MLKTAMPYLTSVTEAFHNPFSKSLECEKGSVTVLVALGLTTLLGFGALVTDIGMFYAQKAKLQNAVDAAALAGVQELPASRDNARSVARDYASRNNTPNITVSFDASNSKITVNAEKQVSTYLARIWGVNEARISAKASAMVIPPTSLAGAAPLCIENQNFLYGVSYTLKSGPGPEYAGDGIHYPGWFGALSLGSGGASNYTENLKNGYTGTLSIGQVIPIETGNMSGPTNKGLNDRIAQDTRIPRNTFDNHDRNAPQIIYVPVVDIVSRNGDSVQNVKVVAFAAFFVEGVSGNGVDSFIYGRFIKNLVPNSQSSASLSDILRQEEQMLDGTSETDFGLYTAKLVDH